MNIYELVTPSDPITFLAPDDKIACFCAVILGSGKAGCNRQDGEKIPSMYMFHDDPIPEIENYLEEKMEPFIEKNRKEISECFLSFAYGDFESRQSYDDAIAAITDAEKLKEFKHKHEDRNRSSMSKWVQGAWNYGNHFAKPKAKKT